MQEKILRVKLWGNEVGVLKWDHMKMKGIFSFNPDFVRKGLDIAPLTASIYSGYGKGENVEGMTFRKQNKFTGLPAFLADSLPDSWGKKLTLTWVKEFGTQTKLTSLDYLAYMDKRAMGALEFEPDGCPWKQDTDIDLRQMFRLADRIFQQRESVSLLPGEEWEMASLCSVGTSAGGMQPKAVLARNNVTGEIRSGQLIHNGDWDYYILKFSNSKHEQQCELEMGYYLMAKHAGIDMMQCSLVNIDGKNHFLTRRFDRINGEKVHLQTLGAMNPSADSYEDIMAVCDELSLPYREKAQMFRRMVFNVYAGCTDDHNRNFSFMMKKDGKWHITPAYDLTFTVSIENGYIEGEEHELSIRGKYTDITDEDLLLFAKEHDIRNARKILSEVKYAISRVREFLQLGGVEVKQAAAIEAYLNNKFKIKVDADWSRNRISNIVLYNDFEKIRCYIDGVQQMGVALSTAEQMKIRRMLMNGEADKIAEVKMELALKYYNYYLNEPDNDRSIGLKL